MTTFIRPSASIACALLLSGCSFLLVQSPPSRPEEPREAKCQEESAAPVADAIIAGLYTIGGIVGAAVAASDKPAPAGTECPLCYGWGRAYGTVVSITSFATAIPYGLSSYFGFRWTKRCRALHRGEEITRVHPDSGSGLADLRTH